jgi:hypothetical protein
MIEAKKVLLARLDDSNLTVHAGIAASTSLTESEECKSFGLSELTDVISGLKSYPVSATLYIGESQNTPYLSLVKADIAFENEEDLKRYFTTLIPFSLYHPVLVVIK